MPSSASSLPWIAGERKAGATRTTNPVPTTAISREIGPAFGTDPMRFVSVNRKKQKKKGRFFR